MVNHRLANDLVTCVLSSDEYLRLEALNLTQSDRSLLNGPAPLVTISIEGVPLVHPTIEDGGDNTVTASWSAATADVTLRLRLNRDSLSWSIDLRGESQTLLISFPFLANIRVDTTETGVLYDAGSFQDNSGRFVFRHADWPLPATWLGSEGRALTLLGGPTSGTRAPMTQLATAGVELVAAPDQQTVWDSELIAHDGGWAAAWERFRQRIRPQFDLSQYQREDTQWYGDQLLQHFTFLYGREILNLDTGAFEIDRFLDEGERTFGGYDGMLIWGVYPRIGIDERTQWDFHDDFPGGRAGLRAMARRARERGVRFFIPYKPWDRAAELRGEPDPVPDHDHLARLVADVEADGVFLDTMAAISPDFRSALDAARAGVVFCSEGRAKGRAFEAITGSWDQSPNRNYRSGNWAASPESMPGVDVWRFVFPEHRWFVINRHTMGADRVRIIQRGFFGGTGWVVWQDIFGMTLPFTTDEAALLKQCRTILREHRQALWSPMPTPLVPTSHADVYCNEFPGTRKRLWTLYNATDAPVSVALPTIQGRPGHHLVDVWNNTDVQMNEAGQPTLDLQPHAIGAIVELPCLLESVADDTSVRLREQIAGAVLEFRQSTTSRQISISNEPIRLESKLEGGPTQVRLLVDGELLDQILLPPTRGASA